MGEKMKFEYLNKNNTKHLQQAANLLADAFPQAYSDNSYEEVLKCLDEERITISAVKEDSLIGFVSAIPQYGITGWELHPLVVETKFRGLGIGERLVGKLENEIRTRGGITVYLGTDDEFFQTSLSGTDLYNDLYGKINNIKNYKNHPFGFYEKVGYKITGVIPDANGFGKPDIIMSKRIQNPDSKYSEYKKQNKQSKIIDLSKKIKSGMEVFPSDPEVFVDIVRTIEKDGWEVRNMKFGTHTGTHTDAFSHMMINEKSIDEIPLNSFFGPAQKVKDLSGLPENTGLVFDKNTGIELLGTPPRILSISMER